MLVKAIRKPGEPGTHNLLKRFGQRLICVRYRYDAAARKRYKTAEIVVAEEEWSPSPAATTQDAMSPATTETPRLAVRIAYHERELRQQVSAAGGTWSPHERLWRVTPEVVERLRLEKRVVRG